MVLKTKFEYSFVTPARSISLTIWASGAPNVMITIGVDTKVVLYHSVVVETGNWKFLYCNFTLLLTLSKAGNCTFLNPITPPLTGQ